MQALIALLKRELSVDFPVTADAPLLSSGLIDSLRFAALLSALEAHYAVTIDPSEVGADNFDTPAQMLAFLATRCPPDRASPTP